MKTFYKKPAYSIALSYAGNTGGWSYTERKKLEEGWILML